MNLLNWFNGVGIRIVGFGLNGAAEAEARAASLAGEASRAGETDALWPWLTIALAATVAIGYFAIAVNWYFHSKLPGRSESRAAGAALARLRGIFLFGVVSAVAFCVNDMPWLVWRLYDAALLALVVYTWSFIYQMRDGVATLDERLHQMAELEKSAARYREIAELLPHMVWTARADGSVDFGNQRWREYASDNRTWLEAVHPDDRARALARWSCAIGARAPMSLEVRLGGSQPGGGGGAGGGGGGGQRTYRTFVVRATPIVKGAAVKWLGACADVEDQKLLAAEKEMQARQKTFFLNALSHDLRAPLHNILLNAHLLKMSPRDEQDVEAVNLIMENAIAAGDLVTRLLDFAKVGGEEQNVIEVFALEPVLQQLVRRFAPSAEQKGLSLGYERCGDGGGDANVEVRVRTDRQKLQRVVGNLIDNAIKYTTRGSIRITCVTQAEQGTESGGGGEESGGKVYVRVSDSGIGIPQENVPYLFDEFYQVNNHERDRSKGFGMGLAICKSLARHIGADVRLLRTGADGSCFEIALDGAVVVTPAGAAAGVRADRGGRPVGAEGDRADPAAAGLCGV
jgi:nitrogen-specific signal transduction histidine kinase